MEPTQTPTKLDKPLILLDMDGVLCDFVSSALNIMLEQDLIDDAPETVLKRWAENYAGEWDICKIVSSKSAAVCGVVTSEDMWRAIHNEGNEFWSLMRETSLYQDLASFLHNLETHDKARVMIATSPSNHHSSYAGKVEWLRSRRINAHSHAMLGSQKHLLAAPGRILVDDNDTNCRKFREHGGRAVLVPQIWNSLHAIAADGEQAQWEYVESHLLQQLEYANLDIRR